MHATVRIQNVKNVFSRHEKNLKFVFCLSYVSVYFHCIWNRTSNPGEPGVRTPGKRFTEPEQGLREEERKEGGRERERDSGIAVGQGLTIKVGQ